MKDRSEVIPLLHALRRPTFFTRDHDFYKPGLCHSMCGETLRIGPPAVRVLAQMYRKLETALEKIFPPQNTN